MTPLDGSVPSSQPAPILPLPVQSPAAVFLRDVVTGLRQSPKQLSPKYFYDLEGSQLFDAICELPEYYVTRTELSILEPHVRAIADRLGRVRVLEPGAGSGTKTRLLLSALGPARCAEYVPIDIAGEHLEATARDLRCELPWLRVTPLAADFTADLPIPPAGSTKTVVYFPGSTIGNFNPEDAAGLLRRFRRAAGPDGLVLVGVDLKKDPALLHAAYNDAQGVTGRFNKNVLRRINEELGGTFDLDAFDHYAFYSPLHGRIEMHLVSKRAQTVRIGSHQIDFHEGESVCTEHSYKYDLLSAERLAKSVGLSVVDRWLDENRHFAILLFRASDRVA